MIEGSLQIGDVAGLAALSVDAVRFSECEGLLGRVRRTPAGQRQDDAEAVRRLSLSAAAAGTCPFLDERARPPGAPPADCCERPR